MLQPARTYDEVVAIKTMIDRTEKRFALRPKRLPADTVAACQQVGPASANGASLEVSASAIVRRMGFDGGQSVWHLTF